MKEKKKTGRPSKYFTNVQPKLEVIKGWARDGLTDEDIASNLNIAISSFYQYKGEFTEFSESLKKGKEESDIEVENSLFNNAKGYYYKEEVVVMKRIVTYDNGKRIKEESIPTTFELNKWKPGETTAQIFWLKNRLPKKWKDKTDLNLGSDDVKLEGIEINFVNKSNSKKIETNPKIIGEYTPAIDKDG